MLGPKRCNTGPTPSLSLVTLLISTNSSLGLFKIPPGRWSLKWFFVSLSIAGRMYCMFLWNYNQRWRTGFFHQCKFCNGYLNIISVLTNNGILFSDLVYNPDLFFSQSIYEFRTAVYYCCLYIAVSKVLHETSF